jgi:hypothetical protein
MTFSHAKKRLPSCSKFQVCKVDKPTGVGDDVSCLLRVRDDFFRLGMLLIIGGNEAPLKLLMLVFGVEVCLSCCCCEGG